MQSVKKGRVAVMLSTAVIAGLLVLGGALPALSAPAGSANPSNVPLTSSGFGAFAVQVSGFPANAGITVASPGLAGACAGTGLPIGTAVDTNGNKNVGVPLAPPCTPGTYTITAFETANPSNAVSFPVTINAPSPAPSATPAAATSPSSQTISGGATNNVAFGVIGTGWVPGAAVAFAVVPACAGGEGIAGGSPVPDPNGQFSLLINGAGCVPSTETITITQAVGGTTRTASATFTKLGPGSTGGTPGGTVAPTCTGPAAVAAPVFGPQASYTVAVTGTPAPTLAHTGPGTLAGNTVSFSPSIISWAISKFAPLAASVVTATNSAGVATCTTAVTYILVAGSPI